jgi:BirA family biotin operon repressor/biotin-[acetyl-CoA-carboxylase] ligase
MRRIADASAMVAEPEDAMRRAGATAFPGFRLRWLARTPSTQDVVRAAARAGAAEGFCCVAAEQTAGRGRQGRRWVAPAGTALLMSLLLRRPARVAAAVPLAAGLALADAVQEVAGVPCRLKWPNDVLAGGGKLAGILAEGDPGGAVVLGLGVNLTVPGFPPDIPGVSLHTLSAVPVQREALLAAFLRHLARRLGQVETGGVPAIRDDWTRVAAGLGGAVRAVTGTRTVVGTALGIGDDGALLVATDGGTLRLAAGEIHLVGG